MSIFRDFLHWLEEHQVGILSTIALHLLIISVFLVLKIRTNVAREYNVLMVDLSLISEMMEVMSQEEDIQQEMSSQEFVQTLRQEYNVRTIPVNTAEERARENIERMVSDLKAEENIIDRPQPRDVPEATTVDNTMRENEARIYDDRFPLNSAGERTIYKGDTTVSYELSGRRHTSMPAPVYRCRIGGTIVVDIVVNANGIVVTADINKSRSNSEDACLVAAAKRDAERSRFNIASTTRQQGTITYIFQAQ